MVFFDRRALLRLSSLSTLAPWTWIADLLGAQEPLPAKRQEMRRDLLRAAARRARDQGRPLLVLLLPAEFDAISALEHWLLIDRLACWLTSDRLEERLDLGLVQLACAAPKDLRACFGEVELPAKAPLAWVEVESFEQAGAPPPRVDSFGPELEKYSDYLARERSGELLPHEKSAYLPAEQARALARALREALQQPRFALRELATRVGRRFDLASLVRLEAWTQAQLELEPELLKHASALLLQRLSELPVDLAMERRTKLGEAIASALLGQRIPGSAWATSLGCGSVVEAPVCEEEASFGMFVCGAGAVPYSARTFLWFWHES